MKTNQPVITIELLFLDLETCDRCCDTDDNLDTAIEQIRSELEVKGTTVNVRRQHVTSQEQAIALGFEISPTIRVNGRDIQLDWRASACGACTELANNANSVDCRVWHWQGEDHTAAPVDMIVDAIRRATRDEPEQKEDGRPEEPSEPMRHFFSSSARANFQNHDEGSSEMKKLEVFDPAMCCPTGVCGVDVDPVLAQFAADLKWVEAQGVVVERHNLGQEPQAFAANPDVVKEMEAGMDRLPILAVDGRIVSTGMYPPRIQLAQKLGVALASEDKHHATTGCGCSPKSGSCC
ncbi:MAG: arsenite efflux transporter metallochaperone ArsD [Burkholderiaceae bacterium]|jgi:hypothetical protein|nr:arsenite efflux transporter metallochaperone ArsD [Burkholderiaceae bacterium]